MSFATARVAPEKRAHPASAVAFVQGGRKVNDMKAIETVYAGHHFRSRLEARWAVFFDTMKIVWRYETQGYEHAGRRYLPDFYLPEFAAWIEVKGDPDGVDRERLAAFLADGEGLPNFKNCAVQGVTGTGLILLGDIPRPGQGLPMHPVLVHSEARGLHKIWCAFFPNDAGAFPWQQADGPLALLEGVFWVSNEKLLESEKYWRVETKRAGTRSLAEIESGYDAARMARFEHGRSG